jgi:hypothetical protein
MDADDVAYPTRFQRQIEFLCRHPDIDVVGTWMLVFRGDGIVRGVRAAPTEHEMIIRRPSSGFRLFHPTWMGKIEWFRTHRYRGYARRCEDQELLLRSFTRSRFANIPDPLLGYREDRVELVPMLCGRAKFAKLVTARLAERSRYGRATAVLLEQAAKAGAEMAAASLRLECLLRNRARSASPDFIAGWEEVWSNTLRRARQLDGERS